MRVLIVALNTYSPPYNDAKLAALARHTDALLAVTGRVPTLWGDAAGDRDGDGYRVQVLDVRQGFSNATAGLVGLRDAARSLAPDLIHIETEPWQRTAVDGVRLARSLGVPSGIQFAENGPMLRGPGGAVRRIVGRAVLRRGRYAIGWSVGSTAVAREWAPDIIHATLPGTGVAPLEHVPDPARWYGADDGAARLAFVGRFEPEKGVDEFCTICDLVAARLPVSVAIAGGGSQAALVDRWAHERPWARVHGVLPRTEVASMLASTDLLVCPSRTMSYVAEQFGKAPVEAMSLGVPVFAYDCGALREVVGDGGVVVPEGDSARLADEIVAYVTSPDRGALGDAARARAARYDESRLADELARIWAAALDA